eukprot:2579218-Rhodomonas_salina.1
MSIFLCSAGATAAASIRAETTHCREMDAIAYRCRGTTVNLALYWLPQGVTTVRESVGYPGPGTRVARTAIRQLSFLLRLYQG